MNLMGLRAFCLLGLISIEIYAQADEASRGQAESRALTTHKFSPDQVKKLVIKAPSVKLTFQGDPTLKEIQLTSSTPFFFSPKSQTLIVKNFKNPVVCLVRAPQELHTSLAGGEVSLNAEGMKGNLDIEAGKATVRGKGPFQDVKVRAGSADVHVEGVQRDLSITAGQGTLYVHYDLVSRAKSPTGLTLSRPPLISLYLSSGTAKFIFPATAALFFLEGLPGLQANFASVRKQPDARLRLYMPPEGAQVELEKR